MISSINGFRKFGLSPEAKRLTEKLPERQQKIFQEWRQEEEAAGAKEQEAKAAQREKNTEAVRRHRERKKAAANSA